MKRKKDTKKKVSSDDLPCSEVVSNISVWHNSHSNMKSPECKKHVCLPFLRPTKFGAEAAAVAVAVLGPSPSHPEADGTLCNMLMCAIYFVR